MKRIINAFGFLVCLLIAARSFAQYQTEERNDTVYLFPKIPFDSVAAKNALGKGNCTIKGVAFTRPVVNGIRMGKKILANKITVFLRPMTPYWEEHLEQVKKENPRKLKFAYVSQACWRVKLTCITNSSGEFVFPSLKPGKYYIYGTLPWSETGVTSEKTGYIDDAYGGADLYSQRRYRNNYEDHLHAVVEIKHPGEVVKVKLRDNAIQW